MNPEKEQEQLNNLRKKRKSKPHLAKQYASRLYREKVKDEISKIIADECPKGCLRDRDIASLISAKGIPVALSTVCDLRLSLGINHQYKRRRGDVYQPPEPD